MAKNAIQSIEPNIANLVNGWIKSYGVPYKLEQESLNTKIFKRRMRGFLAQKKALTIIVKAKFLPNCNAMGE